MKITMYKILTYVLFLGLLISPNSLPETIAAEISENDAEKLQDIAPNVNLPSDAGVDWWANAKEYILQSEYHITWQDKTYLADLPAAYHAANRAHNLRAYFTPQGICLVPRDFEGDVPTWEWGLSLNGYGIDSNAFSTGADKLEMVTSAALHIQENRIEYRRGDPAKGSMQALTEWYINDEQGLHQGFILNLSPSQEGENLGVLELAHSGDLIPHLSVDDITIKLITSDGVEVLHYSEMAVYDATSRSIPFQLELSANTIRIIYEAKTAIYPITVGSLITSPDWIVETGQEDIGFGYSVGTAGDVNGDGLSDVVVGAPNYDNGQMDEGAAFVFHGAVSGLGNIPDWIAESDQFRAGFGYSVGTAGDVDADGYSDLVVGAHRLPSVQTDKGAAFVYHGSPSGLSEIPNWNVEGEGGSSFGIAVGTAGDVNGDGYSDVVVGSPTYTNGGRAFVYHGNVEGLGTTPNWTGMGGQGIAYFGGSVGTAGDVNGDGYSDLIVGVGWPGYYDQPYFGSAYVYHGSVDGLSATPNWTVENDQGGSSFGYSVGTAGDVNGDGYCDVVVGAPRYDNSQREEGRAYMYSGSANGLATAPDWIAEGDQSFAHFGWSVGTAGDVNDDGYSDLVVGVPNYVSGPNPDFPEGGAFVYHGSAGGLGATPDWTAVSDLGGCFGWSTDTAGDVNGDSYSDLVVGSPGISAINVYYGSNIGLNTPPAADAGDDQSVSTNANITLDGTGSSDPDGHYPLSYRWTQVGGPELIFTPTLSVTAFTAPSEFTLLTFNLTVTDSLGLVDATPDEVVIAVDRVNILLPLILKTKPGINGRVSQFDTPVSDVSLELRFYNGADWSTLASTVTDSEGYYAFLAAPSLGSGQKYYVRYLNDTGIAGRLWLWGTRELTSYLAGSSVGIGNFDIGDISLSMPADDETVALPYTFYWSPRPTSPSDTYEFNLYDSVNDDPYFYTDPPLGYVDSYTLNSLPPDFSSGVPYAWEIWVYSPDGGFGISYEMRQVTFSNTGIENQTIPNYLWLRHSSILEDLPDR